MASGNNATSIIVAVIGVVGVLGAAVISNWDKFSPASDASSSPETAVSPSPSTPSDPVAQSDNYPEFVKQNFMASCTLNGGPEATCACALNEIQQQYSLDEFQREEIRMVAQGTLSDKMANILMTCQR